MLHRARRAVVVHETGVRIDELAYVEPLDVVGAGRSVVGGVLRRAGGDCADGGSLRLEHVCVNETRIGFLEQLERMGAVVTQVDARLEGGEPVADIIVAPGELRAATITRADVPAMVDELPLLACLATRAAGETTITGADELRVKESDRIAAVVANLRAIGARRRGAARRDEDPRPARPR